MKKNNKKKGFTLMELLIVIAIIVILVAIAIPSLSGQTTKAKETADIANIRSAYAVVSSDALSNGKTLTEDEVLAEVKSNAGELNYDGKLKKGTNSNLVYEATKIDEQSWDISGLLS